MQLEGATELEKRLYRACLENEKQPASESQTVLACLLCDAANQLQDMRQRGQILMDACLAFHKWVDDHDDMLNNPEFLALYNSVCDSIGSGSTLRTPLAVAKSVA